MAMIAAPGQGLRMSFGGGAKPPFKVEHRVGIRAPAEAVWELIKDLDRWPAWSPLYPAAAGQLRGGAQLSLTLALPGLDPREITPRIVDWVPYEQILWADSDWKGWARSTRFFELEALSKEACIFSNGEVFEDTMSRIYGRRRRQILRAAFEAHGDAVKRTVERLWDDAQEDK